MTPEQLWQATLGELELILSKANFITWFKQTSVSSFENNRLAINVPNTFTKTWLEKKYLKTILNIVQQLSNREIKEVVFQVGNRSSSFFPPSQTPTTKFPQNTPIPVIDESGLNPRYLFDNFIVGKGNELAHAAAKAVAENPGTVYNPLFIYGGVGLGKTHLLQAIGNEIKKRYPEKKVLYATCETFTNEFIEAIRNGRGKKFHDTYRVIT
jgi:chromosomal replication initiator protein